MANLQRIKELSKEKKIPIKKMASLLGITEQGLHKMIRDKTMSVENLERIAKILNVSVIVFFDEDQSFNNKEEYLNYAERGFAVKNIENVNQEAQTDIKNEANAESQSKEIILLQKELLKAKTEIINLLMERK